MNDKKIGFLGSSGSVRGASFMSTKELLLKVGQNTGNLFFQYAVYNLIKEDKCIIGVDIPWDPKIVREMCRILVVPSANFLRENFDLTGYVSFLESCDLPILFIGLGAQADSYDARIFDFHPSIKRLVGLIKDQNIGVGVRGEFTARVLNDHGVTNFSIIGCPSNFTNPDENLSEVLKTKWLNYSSTIITTGDEPWPKRPIKQLAERKLIQLAREMSGIYVQQSVEPFVNILRRSNPYQGGAITDGLQDSLRSAIAPDMDSLEFRRFLSSSVRLYVNIDQWLEEASKFDLAIGLRLHGNMVAFQSGCPAIWVHHDARTLELVETMCLPNLSLEKFLSCKSVDEFKAESNADFDKYGIARVALRSELNALFSSNNIL
jgi:hypothetical protein